MRSALAKSGAAGDFRTMSSSHHHGLIEVAPGLRLNVVVDGPADAPALLLSNSLGSTLAMWDDVVSRLGPRLRIVRYDTRGHGGSDVPPGPYSVAELGRDALGVLNALGIRKTAICGLSLGGITAMWIATHAPERVGRAVLANTGAFLPTETMWRERAATARTQGLAGLVEPSMERWFTAGCRQTMPDLVAKGAAMVSGTPPEGYAGCCEAIASMDQRETVSGITAPTLVIVGDQDPSTSPAMGEALREAIPGATLVSLPAAHLSAMEVPEAFAEALSGWLAA